MKHEELRQLIREEIQNEILGFGNKPNKDLIKRSLNVLERGFGVLKRVDGGKLVDLANSMQEHVDTIRKEMGL